MTSDQTTPDPHAVPQVSFGGRPDEETQDEADRERQKENAETSQDQPST